MLRCICAHSLPCPPHLLAFVSYDLLRRVDLLDDCQDVGGGGGVGLFARLPVTHIDSMIIASSL